MLKQFLLMWLSTRPLSSEAKAIGAFLIWFADETSWRVRRLQVRKVAEFTSSTAAEVEATIDYLEEHFIIASGEVRDGVINCQLDVLQMARSCAIRFAEAGYRTEFEIVSGYIDSLSPDANTDEGNIIKFPGQPQAK